MWDFVGISYSELSISVVNYGHIRSTCNVIRAGGWNIWATHLLNHDRNPLTPNNWETAEDPLSFCDETSSHSQCQNMNFEGTSSTSNRSNKQPVLSEWFISKKIYSRWQFPRNKLLVLLLPSFNNLLLCCKYSLGCNFSVVILINILVIFSSNELITFAAKHQISKQRLQSEREKGSLGRQKGKEN